MNNKRGVPCYTNLWEALNNKDFECARLIVDHPNFDANEQQGFCTVLHKAVCTSSFAIVTRLIELGADVNMETASYYPPVFYVGDNNTDLQIARKLIANGARRCNGISYMNHVFKSYDAYRSHVVTVLLCKYAPATCPDVVRFIAKHLWSMRLEFLNNT